MWPFGLFCPYLGLFLYWIMCVFAHLSWVCACKCNCSRRPEEVIGTSGVAVTGGCEPSHWVLASHSSPLEEQFALLTAGTHLQPWFLLKEKHEVPFDHPCYALLFVPPLCGVSSGAISLEPCWCGNSVWFRCTSYSFSSNRDRAWG